MIKFPNKLLLRVAAIVAVILATPADAKNGHDKGGHEKGPHHETQNQSNTIIIQNNDRVFIREYLHEEYGRGCPPGLAKKHNGCTPPGHAKRYVVGRPIPADVVFVPAPTVIVEKLHPVPAGYRYVQIDEDILLINEASHKIIDAVTLLSAVN